MLHVRMPNLGRPARDTAKGQATYIATNQATAALGSSPREDLPLAPLDGGQSADRTNKEVKLPIEPMTAQFRQRTGPLPSAKPSQRIYDDAMQASVELRKEGTKTTDKANDLVSHIGTRT